MSTMILLFAMMVVMVTIGYIVGPRSAMGWRLTATDMSEINRLVFESNDEHAKKVLCTFWFGSSR